MNANFVMETKEVEAEFYLDNKIVKGSGTNNHNELANRELPNQHPMSAITGLEEAIPTKVSQLENDSGFITENEVDLSGIAHLTGEETLTDKTLVRTTIKDELSVTGDEQVGERFQISFINGTTQIATNNGLDILPITNFVTSPTIEADDDFSKLLPNNFVSKKQVLQAVEDGLSNSDFVTEAQVDQKIANIETGGTISLDSYLSKEEASETYSTKENLANHNSSEQAHIDIRNKIEEIKTDIPSKVSQLENDKGYLTEHQSLENYATKSDLNSKADAETIDDVFDELTTLQDAKLDKKLGVSNSGKWLKVDTSGNVVPDTLPASGGGGSSIVIREW